LSNVFNFTVPRLKGLKPGPKRTEYFDSGSQGKLTLRVGVSGTKTFYAMDSEIKPNGTKKRVREKIGNFPALSLDEAREKCIQITQQWANPKKTLPTLKHYFEKEYFEKHSKKRKKSWKNDELNFRLHVGPAFGEYRLDEITRPMVMEFHSKLGEQVTESGIKRVSRANRVLSLLSAIFTYAMKQDLIDKNPCHKIDKFPEKAKTSSVTSEQFKELEAIFDNLPDPYMRVFFKLAMETAARRKNILEMRWQDIDFGVRVWHVKGEFVKNGEPLYIPLHSKTISDLKGLQGKISEKSKSCPDAWRYVFPGLSGGHMHFPKRLWKKIQDSLEFDIIFHDLRRSRSTHLLEQGVPVSTVMSLTGHKDPKTLLKHYHAPKIDSLREALTRVDGED